MTYQIINTKLVSVRVDSHHADGASAEFHGKVFTHTFIPGAFAGKAAFYEPTVTPEYPPGEPRQGIPIEQPQAFAAAGNYPTLLGAL